jgi:hypothetical protein
MYKRKIMGIQMVPEDTHRKNTGFQEGGTVAVSKAYDWRDDPYELICYNKGCTNCRDLRVR